MKKKFTGNHLYQILIFDKSECSYNNLVAANNHKVDKTLFEDISSPQEESKKITRFFYKHIYKQRHAEIGKKSSKS